MLKRIENPESWKCHQELHNLASSHFSNFVGLFARFKSLFASCSQNMSCNLSFPCALLILIYLLESLSSLLYLLQALVMIPPPLWTEPPAPTFIFYHLLLLTYLSPNCAFSAALAKSGPYSAYIYGWVISFVFLLFSRNDPGTEKNGVPTVLIIQCNLAPPLPINPVINVGLIQGWAPTHTQPIRALSFPLLGQYVL